MCAGWVGVVAGVAAGAVAVTVGVTTAGAQAAGSSNGPRACVPAIGTNQIVLPLPGVFLPLPDLGGGDPEYDRLPPAPADAELPGRVVFRDDRQGVTSRVQVVLDRGHLYAKPAGPAGDASPWRRVPTPDCLDGAVVAVSVDENMLVAVDSAGWMYSLDNLLSGPMLWNWTRSYGSPIWLWPGARLAADPARPGAWSASHRISRSFVDGRGVTHPTTAGLVQVVSLTGDGSRIVYQDPWLPPDHSYEIGGPLGGRFRSVAVSTSESVTFVVDAAGRMFTRKYDLDLAGANHIPGRYTWQDQPPLPSAPDQLRERVDPSFAAVSLPAPDWQAQPTPPGQITDRISVVDTGDRMEDKELRVEGRSGGRDGFWAKPLEGGEWTFVVTDRPLIGTTLDTSAPAELAPPTGIRLEGPLPGGWTARLDDFDWAQTTRDVRLVAPSGREYTARLHTTDALRLTPRGPGLDAQPRHLEGALDLRPARPWAPGNEELAAFSREHLWGREVAELALDATDRALVVDLEGFLGARLGVWGRVGA